MLCLTHAYVSKTCTIVVFAVFLRFRIETHNFRSIEVAQFETTVTQTQPLAQLHIIMDTVM
jgi:hypothetical protein